MDPEKIIDKLSGLAIIPDLYKDLPQPLLRKVSAAIGDALDFVFIPTQLMRYSSDWVSIHLKNNLKKVSEKLDEIPEENIIPASPEITIPILQKLPYTTNEDIATLFANLIAKASNCDTTNLAHPSFINLIERISADEAKIIAFISNQNHYRIPYFEVYWENDYSKMQTLVERYLTDIVYTGPAFPENMSFYFSNLISLGILQDMSPKQILLDAPYKTLMALHSQRLNTLEANKIKGHSLKLVRSGLDLTAYGKQFIKSCFRSASGISPSMPLEPS